MELKVKVEVDVGEEEEDVEDFLKQTKGNCVQHFSTLVKHFKS